MASTEEMSGQMNLICHQWVLLDHPTRTSESAEPTPTWLTAAQHCESNTAAQGSKGLRSLQDPACAVVWGGTVRVSQDGTGLEGLVLSKAKNGAACGGSVFCLLSGKVAGALMHTLTHTVSQLTGRGNALHFPAACPQAKPKCQP